MKIIKVQYLSTYLRFSVELNAENLLYPLEGGQLYTTLGELVEFPGPQGNSNEFAMEYNDDELLGGGAVLELETFLCLSPLSPNVVFSMSVKGTRVGFWAQTVGSFFSWFRGALAALK